MKTLIFLIALISLTSCATTITTNYKVVTPNGNFYVEDISFCNDSVYLVEWTRSSKIRRTGVFKESEVIINGN